MNLLSLFAIFMALFALGLLVFIHELGHYIIARKVGMKVEAFSIGFGKPLIQWEYQGVKWQVCALPFGGFVKIAGMEKQGVLEPHDIEGGFFHSSPLNRIKVALAGPIVNIVFALVLFTIIFLSGGRIKPFSEYTQFLGWINPKSALYTEQKVRPGDLLMTFDGEPYKGVLQLRYAEAVGQSNKQVTGEHINYKTGKRTPFTAQYSKEAIEQGARYFNYQKTKEKDAPINQSALQSGIEEGDRVVWADGQFLFSQKQLASLMNDGHALVSFSRGDEIFWLRVPKIAIQGLNLTEKEKAEYAQKGDLLLPFLFDNQLVVQASLTYLQESKEMPFKGENGVTVEKGDKLRAVDGVAISSQDELIKALQHKKIVCLVKKARPDETRKPTSWKEADEKFEIDGKVLAPFLYGFANSEDSDYKLLKPIDAKPLEQFYDTAEGKERFKKDRAHTLDKLKNDPKRLAQFQKSLEENRLGLFFMDQMVVYNPQPFTLFGNVFQDIRKTLSALFKGFVSPKELSGPIGIVQVMHYGWMVSFNEALYWIGLISLNLGVMNLLPIPVLDGGHICFSLYEMITRRRIKAKMMEKLILPFVILLIAFFIFVTFHDLKRLFYLFF